MVVVAIDKDKGSQGALKWAVDHLLSKGKTVTLLHVKLKQPASLGSFSGNEDASKISKVTVPIDGQTKELFFPFRCFCTRKDIRVKEEVVEDTDVARALIDYVKNNSIEDLVVGSTVKNGFMRRFKIVDIPGNVSKGAPEFCNVYVISKGKISSEMQPIDRRGNASNRSYGDFAMLDTDISYVSSGRPSNERMIHTLDHDMSTASRLSNSSDTENRSSFGSSFSNTMSSDANYSFGIFSSSSNESGNYSWSGSQTLDHTPVAIKVLRPDAAQGRSQFQQEVEVLSCIRHPNMVLLLGACPEYGCLVYEYMANGSLDDCLFKRGNTPVLSWQLRFRIAAEIGTSLLFLHQTKPEPLVHRDLKPGNILLDSNFVSKISDVGLARLVPPSVADNATQYLMTSTAGTFCYIDPEYQQTGMLGIKSDVYSFGVMLLQIITAKSPMGLTHHIERAIERGNFADMLDPAVTDWPVEEAKIFAKLALKCTELRRKDRPDLGTVVLPELKRLRAFAEESMSNIAQITSPKTSPNHSQSQSQVNGYQMLSSSSNNKKESSVTGTQSTRIC